MKHSPLPHFITALVFMAVLLAFAAPPPAQAQVELLTNGSFETGDFTGWTPLFTSNPLPYCYPEGWRVVPTGFDECNTSMGANGQLIHGFVPVAATHGTYVASNGFDGGPMSEFSLHQDVTIPADGTTELSFDYRIQYRSYNAWNNNRTFLALFVNPVSNTVITTLHEFNTGVPPDFPVGVPQNTGWQSISVDVSSYAGTTVRLMFYNMDIDSFGGPSMLELDNVSLLNTPSVISGTVTVNPTTVNIAEDGISDNFSITLSQPPMSQVSIGLTTDGQCTVSPNLVIIPAGSTGPAWITVLPVDDSDIEGAHTCIITTEAASSTDLAFAGVAVDDVTANITDNDIAGIIISPMVGLAVTEDGATSIFDVVLNAPPADEVSITLVPDAQCTVSPTMAVFAAGAVGPVTFTVTPVDDAVVEGAHSCTIVTNPAVSSDANYNGIDPPDLTVSVADNDIAGIIISPSVGLAVAEGGATSIFDVVLNAPSSEDVTLTLVPDAQCTVSPTTVVFAAGAVGPATITVTAVDDAVVEGAHSCTIVTNAVVSNDANYNGIDPPDLTVSVADNDTADISITPLNVTVRENRPARTYQVVLTNAPAAGEIVTVTPTFNTAQITVSPATLQFNDSNWNVPQTFSVEAVDNAVADGQRTTTITHALTSTVSGSPFDGIPAPDVTVTVRDDDGGNNSGGGGNNGGGSGGQTVAAAPPVPLCADLNGTTNTIVRANPPAGVYGVHCRVIAESTRFIRSAAEVGVQSVLDRGVIHAVDVFSPSNASAGGTNICLQGTGELLFLDASAAPRTAQPLPASTQGGYTCATLPNVGTVVLVNGAAAPAAVAPVVAATSTPLTGCTVTTTHAVRLRAEPNASSAVLTTLPYDGAAYQATERLPGWLRLIWGNTQGWVSDDYLNTSGSCGG